MKIAVISDIHANLIALKAVLADIEKESCNKVYCLGDIVLGGPNPLETIDFVRKQNWTIIQGNTDKLIADYNEEILKYLQEHFPVIANAMEDDVKLLSEEQIEYLRNLPENLELTVDGIKILLVHGSPRYNNEDIKPNLPIEEIEKIIENTDSDLILCGHTHIPCGYQTTTKQTVVNVGSVGRPLTDNVIPCYAIIEINDNKFTVKHNFVDYDRKTAYETLCKRNFKNADKLAQLLINPTNRHI